MAKFQGKHLKLKDDQRAYFGTGDDSSLWYDGSEMRLSTTISGVTPVQGYQLTTKQYVDDAVISGVGGVDHSDYVIVDGTRPFTSTIDGIYPTTSGNLATKAYVDEQVVSLPNHSIYSLIDGTRAFIGEVGGVTPTQSGSLTTKWYVDQAIEAADPGIDHSQYVLTDGSRGFTNTISGVDPTQPYHLSTKEYVDSQTGANHKSNRVSLALNDSSKAVVFGEAYGDTDYSISITLVNTVDAIPSIYPMMVSAKATTGFTVLFSGDMDSANYTLEWLAKKD